MSTKLMTSLSTCPVDLGSIVGLNPVCIDNQDVRKRLLKNGKIEISAVPCILLVYRSGEVEKYEGNDAFQWIEETINKYAPPQSPETPPQIFNPPPPQIFNPPQPQIFNPPQPQKKEVRPKIHPEKYEYQQPEEEEEQEEEEEEEEEEEVEYIPPPKSFKKTKYTQKSKKETTAVEDLGVEPSLEKEYPISEETINKSVKGKDLLSAAAAMQKERDASDSNKIKMKGNNK